MTKNLKYSFKQKNNENVYVTVFDCNCYYGSNYLEDMVLSTRYSDSPIICKEAFYNYENNDFKLINKELAYVYVNDTKIYRNIIDKDLLVGKTIFEIIDNFKINDKKILSIDEFNFCDNYNALNCPKVDDIVIDMGIDYDLFAERLSMNKYNNKKYNIKNGNILQKDIKLRSNNSYKIKGEIVSNIISITTDLQTIEEKEYMYIDNVFSISEYLTEKTLNFLVVCNKRDNISFVCILLDEEKNKIKPYFFAVNNMVTISEIPKKAKFFEIAFRISGIINRWCTFKIEGILTSGFKEGDFLLCKDICIFTNIYPSKEDIYGNMFVHSRVVSYKNNGMNIDVFVFNDGFKFREFQGVDIIEGNEYLLESALKLGHIKVLCVHFLNINMWKVIKNYINDIKIIIWLSDIQPWWRRTVSYTEKTFTR